MSVIKIRKGFDVPIHGGLASTAIEDGPPIRTVAIKPQESIGMKGKLLVHVGEEVLLGQPLVCDRRDEAAPLTSPGSGKVIAVHRGKRRAIQSVVVELDGRARQAELPHPGPQAGGAELRAALLRSGLWQALRQRPFGKVPASDAEPRALFVTAMDSEPLAPPPLAVLAGREEAFRCGLAALGRLISGPVWLCTRAKEDWSTLTPPEVRHQAFSGPHPAGNPSVHINALEPAAPGRISWHIGYQDVADLGAFLLTGQLSTERVVAVVGPGVSTPALLRTRRGAPTADLVEGRLAVEHPRVISGSVLSGHTSPPGSDQGYLGRFANQVAVLDDQPQREFLSWASPFGKRHTFTNAALAKFFRKELRFDTDTNGSLRALVPIGSYDRVLPMDIMATQLVRALASDDLEGAEKLGLLELVEEDVALCEYVCPSKMPITSMLRDMLTRSEKEG